MEITEIESHYKVSIIIWIEQWHRSPAQGGQMLLYQLEAEPSARKKKKALYSFSVISRHFPD